MIYYYTYEIKFLCGSFKNKYYYGRRTSRVKPETDKKYNGSGVIPQVYFNKYPPSDETRIKTILNTYNSLEELINAEQELLNKHCGQPYCVNFNTNSKGGGCNKGRICIYKNNRARYIYPEYLDEFLEAGYTLGRMKGQIPTNKGVPLTEEQRKRDSEAITNLWKNEKYRNKIVNSLKGNKRALGHRLSNETKQLLREKNSGVITINNGEIEKHCKPEELGFYETIGFTKGRLKENIYIPSEETRNKLSESLKGKNKGKHRTKEEIENLKHHFEGTKLMTDGVIRKYIKLQDVEEYINNGWTFFKRKVKNKKI